MTEKSHVPTLTEEQKIKLVWFVKENTWLDRSYSKYGWGNGYVCVPKGHPAYGESYDSLYEKFPDIEAHGGLTFADAALALDWPEIPASEKDSWIFGFDTAHWQDDLDRWPKEAVERETQRLAQQLESL
jgi:hypothetical protein